MTDADTAVGPVARVVAARRSVRAFADRPVPDEALRTILASALRASCLQGAWDSTTS